jgi:hypothetical protein
MDCKTLKETYETECKKYLALRSSVSDMIDSELSPEQRNEYLAMKADSAHKYLVCRRALETLEETAAPESALATVD